MQERGKREERLLERREKEDMSVRARQLERRGERKREEKEKLLEGGQAG